MAKSLHGFAEDLHLCLLANIEPVWTLKEDFPIGVRFFVVLFFFFNPSPAVTLKDFMMDQSDCQIISKDVSVSTFGLSWFAG